jgi:hypothetical protein
MEQPKKYIPWNKGITYTLKPLSEETKLKISLSRKGQPAWNKGKKQSEQHRLNNRLSHLGQVSKTKGKHSWYRGELHARWKGGITTENQQVRHSIEYKLWKDSVFARDHWNCQNCGKMGGNLEAHHIKGFASNPELRFAIDNGITLCLKCHRKVHSRLDASQVVELAKQKEG